MRMTNRIRRGDRGTVLIVVAAFTIVSVGFLAFVVDIGDQRQNRRQLTTATDAPALAVANQWAVAGASPSFDCSSTDVDDVLAVANNPVGNPDPDYQCSIDEASPFRGGIVTVSSTENVDHSFGGVTGVDAASVGSLTSVRVDTVVGGGLRPVAFCSGDFSRTDWTSPAPGIEVAPASATTTITLTNSRGRDADPCSASGNWSQVILREHNACPGTANASGGAGTFRDQYVNGSPFDVAVNDCLSRLPGNGGFSSGDPKAIEGMTVFFPVFDSADGGGAGIYLVKGFLEAHVESVVHHGNTTTFELKPLRYITSGPCCLVNEFNARVVMCDTGTLAGTANLEAATRCEPRAGAGNPVEPEIPDGCEVEHVAPADQQVVVDVENKSTVEVTVEVVVRDSTDCGSLSVEAISATATLSAYQDGSAGNSYFFTFPAGTVMAPSGTQFVFEVSENGLVLPGFATMTTVDSAGPCTATDPELEPTVPATAGGSGNLNSPVSVSAELNDEVACSGATIRIVRVSDGAAVSPLSRTQMGTTLTATFGKHGSQAWQWAEVLYAAEVRQGGQTLSSATFTPT